MVFATWKAPRMHVGNVRVQITDVAMIDPDVLPFCSTRIRGFRRSGEYADFHIGKS